MRSSHNIWIPSLQHTLRFKDLTFDQYGCIINILDDNDLEFISTLNEIIHENIVSKFDVDRLTTLDRFIIFLSLKINSCGNIISLSKKCDNEKCEKVTNVKMDLNQLVDNIAPNIDRRFTTSVQFGSFGAICDIPTIKTEHEIYTFNNIQNVEFRSLDFNLNNYIFSHIVDIFIGTQQINLNKMEHQDRITVLNKIPAGLINQIQLSFLKDIHQAVSDIDFLKINCKDCNKPFEIKFDISNINDVLKVIYKDESTDNLLHTIINVCSQTYMGSYIGHLSPMAVNRINKILSDAQKKQDPQPQQNKDIDLFDKYREETAHLQESQSEFAL
jgi:hypothetical protein